MNSVLQKLKLKDQAPVLVLGLPDDMAGLIEGLPSELHTKISGRYSFILAFIRDLAGARKIAESLAGAYETGGYLWIAYPKGSSKRYKSDANRDKLWDLLGPYGFEPVTQFSMNDDWSAMRFRRAEEIKKLSRKTAASEKGKERLKASR